MVSAQFLIYGHHPPLNTENIPFRFSNFIKSSLDHDFGIVFIFLEFGPKRDRKYGQCHLLY